MENISMLILQNMHIIIIISIIIGLGIPFIFTVFRNKKRKVKRTILDKKTIMIYSGVSDQIVMILFLSLFFVVGLIIVYLSTTKEFSISGIIGGSIICIIPTIITLRIIKLAINILHGNYVIIEDELMDKHYYHSYDDTQYNNRFSGWLLYFKYFFKKYNNYVKVQSLREGNNYKIGDKFYLVFVKGNSIPYVFSAKEYKLDQSEKGNLKTIDDIDDYTKLKEFVLEKNVDYNENIILTPKKIINDFFNKSRKQAFIFFIFVPIFLLIFGIVSYILFFNIPALIIISIVFVVFLFMSIIIIKHYLTIINNIKNDNYKIKSDEIISLNARIPYSDSNTTISFKFKNYKKIVYAEKKDFTDVKIGDKFYLVFVEGSKEPINVYNVKNTIIDSSMKKENLKFKF